MIGSGFPKNVDVILLDALLRFSDLGKPSFRDELIVESFQQYWGNSAMGFDLEHKIVAQAFFKQQTFIITNGIENDIYLVYFGTQFAYKVENPNEHFAEDRAGHHMRSLKQCNSGKDYEWN